MKRFAGLVLLGGALGVTRLPAADVVLHGSRPGANHVGSLQPAETFRTDINPALLYYQGFSLRPELSAADHDYLFTNEWRSRVLDEKFSDLISTYGKSFKLFRRAGKAEVPCDWGLDLSDGPNALLPGLAKAKSAKIDFMKLLAVFGQLLPYRGIDRRNLYLAGMHLRH